MGKKLRVHTAGVGGFSGRTAEAGQMTHPVRTAGIVLGYIQIYIPALYTDAYSDQFLYAMVPK